MKIVTEKNSIYAYTKNINDKGLALAVLDIDSKDVVGVQLLLNDTAKNFSITYNNFCEDQEKDILVFVEKLPKFVVKDLKKIYKANLKKS